jgi:glycosyltransferase involved in cell wall biosynthesis
MPPEDSGGLPLVSVVVPFLDAERFLADAIESVLAQTYSRWELVLVDDGSSDGSTELAQAYAARYRERLRLLRRPEHRNLSAARNYGVNHSHGKYVAFLDADDVWMRMKLEEQVAILETVPEAAATYGKEMIWYSWTGRAADATRDVWVDLGLPSDALVRPPELLRLVLESRIPTPSPSCFAIRRDAFEAVGGFDEGFCARHPVFEDQALLSKVYLTESVYVSSACWVRYRRHANSLVSQAVRSGDKVAAGRSFCDFVAARLTERGVTDESLWRALDKKRWRYQHPTLDHGKHVVTRCVHRLRNYARLSLRKAQSTVSSRSS